MVLNGELGGLSRSSFRNPYRAYVSGFRDLGLRAWELESGVLGAESSAMSRQNTAAVVNQ